jgi:hypothetical protein
VGRLRIFTIDENYWEKNIMNTPRKAWLQSFEKEMGSAIKNYGFKRTCSHTWEKVRDGIRFIIEVQVDEPNEPYRMNVKYVVFTPPSEPSEDQSVLAEACVGRLTGRENVTYRLPYYFMYRLRKAGKDILKDVETTLPWFSENFGTRKACLNYLEQSDMNHDCLWYKYIYRYLTETMHLAGFSGEKVKEK